MANLLGRLGFIAALVAGVFLAGYSFSVQNAESRARSSPRDKLVRDIFRELVEIKTTAAVGSTKAAGAMAARLITAGFPAGDVQVLGPRDKNKNLVARYRGTGKLRPILFIGHLDVVEARREDWSFDPFVFREQDGFFYGRGTSDMKGEDADLVANFIRLRSEGYIPDRDMILALTDDEESGDANGVSWLVENHRDPIDAELCVNPDGGSADIRNGKRATLAVQTSEKVYISYELEVKNKGGHSSLPVKDNAIYRLAAGLIRLALFDFPVRLNETTRAFFERAAAQESAPMRADMLSILKTPGDAAAESRISASSAYYNALMRTTCVATMLSAGHAENALPQRARAIVNCRMLPDDTPDNILATLRRVLDDPQISVTPLNQPFLSPVSPLRKDVQDAVERLTASMWPGAVVTPIMSTGATDGKYLRRAGIPVYGISGLFGDVDDVRAHGKDERVGVREFYEGVDFMYQLMKALSSARP